MTKEERGLPEDASMHQQSGTGKSTTPSPMMADNAATLIANLRKLSDSVSAFQCCFTELHQHIDSIRSTIHSVLPGLAINTSTLLPASSTPAAVSPVPALAPAPISKPEPSWESDPSEEEGEEEMQSPRGEEVQSPRSGEVQSPHSEEVQSPHREEVQSPLREEVQSPHRSELKFPHRSKLKSSDLSELKSPHRSELENIFLILFSVAGFFTFRLVLMVEPADTATASPPQSRPSPAVQVQSQLLETVNALQSITKQSEFQQPPTNDDSIANFRKLSDAFSAFQVCFAELQQHVDSVRTLIDSMRPPDTINATPLSVSSLPAATAPAPETEAEPSSEFNPSEEEEVEVKSPGSELKSTRSELESLCERMDGRGLRKYMTTHLADLNGLVEEVPKALKLSPNPARLVLDCLGKFYFQGSRAYINGSPLVNGRKASILVLECFLLMGIDEGVEIEKGVKEEAEKAALAWRKRLIAEGGLRKAFDMDARGLLLLIGCFGIPGGFINEDIRDLLLASPFKKNMSGGLTRSNVFMAKITEIIEGMVNQKMEIEAVDIAYSFGIEDRFNPQKLVTSFLRECKEPLKKLKGKSQGSLADVNEAKKKHLFALRSVVKCSRRHSIDLSKLLPGWQINEKIMSLEKEIAVEEKKMVQKRKIDETESSGRISNKEAKQSHFPNPRLQQEGVVNHIDSNTTLLEGGTAGHMYGYSVPPPVLHGPGGHGRILVDSTPIQIGSHTGQLYGLHGDVAVYGRLPSHSYAYGPSSYLAGSTALPNTKPGDAYGPPPYLEGSRGLPNAIPTDVAGRSSASDPYQFDDTVTTSELYRSSGLRAVDVVPSAASAHHSSYLYTGPDSFALGRHYFQP